MEQATIDSTKQDRKSNKKYVHTLNNHLLDLKGLKSELEEFSNIFRNPYMNDSVLLPYLVLQKILKDS